MKVVAAILLLCVAYEVLRAPPSNPSSAARSFFDPLKCYADLNVPITKMRIPNNLTDDQRVCALACYLQRINMVNANAIININGILNANPKQYTEIQTIINKCQSVKDQNTSKKKDLCVIAGCLRKEQFLSVVHNTPTNNVR